MRKTILAAVLLLPALALASGYEVPNVNPRDLAMVSSTVAAQRDAAATNVNPAALSRVEGLQFSLAGSALSLHTEWTAPAGSGLSGDEKTDFHPVPPVALFAAWGTKIGDRGVGLGLGMGNPGGGNMFWADDWEGRGRIITVQRRVYGYYLTGGVEAVPNLLRLGGGAIYYRGTQYLKQGIQPVEGAYAELAVEGGAFSYEASAELEIPGLPIPVSLGVDYKHKAHIRHTGDANFEVPPGLETPATQDQGAENTLVMPNILHVGAAVRPVKPLLLTAGWSFIRFKVYQEDRFIPDAGEDIVVPRNYTNGFGLRFGAEYTINPSWEVRGGFFRDFSGLDTDTYSPTLPDSDSWIVAGGATYNVNPNFALNAGFYYADRDRVESTNWRTAENPTGSFPGSYKTRAYIASFGITWKTGLLTLK